MVCIANVKAPSPKSNPAKFRKRAHHDGGFHTGYQVWTAFEWACVVIMDIAVADSTK